MLGVEKCVRYPKAGQPRCEHCVKHGHSCVRGGWVRKLAASRGKVIPEGERKNGSKSAKKLTWPASPSPEKGKGAVVVSSPLTADGDGRSEWATHGRSLRSTASLARDLAASDCERRSSQSPGDVEALATVGLERGPCTQLSFRAVDAVGNGDRSSVSLARLPKGVMTIIRDRLHHLNLHLANPIEFVLEDIALCHESTRSVKCGAGHRSANGIEL